MQLFSVYFMSKCMNTHICSVRVQHMSREGFCPCASVVPSSSLLCSPPPPPRSQSPEMPSDRCWEAALVFKPSSRCLLCMFLQQQVCLPPVPPPSSLLPVPLSLQYGSSVWEAAIPLFSRPLHPKVLLWVLAPLSPPQSMSGTGSKSLWYLAPRRPEHVTAFLSPFPLPGQSSLLSLCCRSPPSCFCLCCTLPKPSNPASSVCQRLSTATFCALC